MKHPLSLLTPTTIAALCLGAAVLQPGIVRSQGSLTPLGAPAPTMKTLDQIEPRRPIDAINTPGDAASVFRITAPGSYFLTAPLTGVAGKHGISIESSYVTVDLSGFPVTGVASALDGIHIGSGHNHVAIRNGIVTAWEEDGIDAVDASDSSYESILATNNSGDGLRLGPNCTVKACKLSFNGGHGFSANGDATVSRSTATNNGLSGFYQASGPVTGCFSTFNGSNGFVSKAAEFSHCVANGNVGNGFEDTWNPAAAGPAGFAGALLVIVEDAAGSYTSCVANANGGWGFLIDARPMTVNSCTAAYSAYSGIRVGGGANVAGCTLSNSGNWGIDAGDGSTITGCTLRFNSFAGVIASGYSRLVENTCDGNNEGIFVYGDRNRIEGNNLVGSWGTGLRVSGIRNLIIKNSASYNLTDYDVAADNRLVVVTAPASLAVVGSSGGAGVGTTDPFANLSY